MRAKHYHYFGKEEGDVVNQFVETINWKPLHEHLQKLGFDTPLDVSLKTDGYEHYTVNIKGTQNLVDRVGIMAPCFKSVYLQDFGTLLYQEVDCEEDLRRAAIANREFDKTWTDFDAVFGPIVLGINFHLRYTTKDGGSNGAELFLSKYTAEKGWTFRER